MHFYPRPVLAFGYCRCLRLCVCLSVCQSLACPRDNSGSVQARITQFEPKMQRTLVKVPIVLWTDRPWLSRSNLTWKSKFTPFCACPHHNSSSTRIIKFGPEVQSNSVKILFFWGGGQVIDLDLQGKIWLKKSNIQVLPCWLLVIHNHHVVIREPCVPRLFHEPDTVSILCMCMCSYA